MNASGSFKDQKAPCGKMVDGELYEDQDPDARITQETVYTCGCQSIKHEYHDGTFSTRVVRHDGVVLKDELIRGE
jgi:hypothetical protein